MTAPFPIAPWGEYLATRSRAVDIGGEIVAPHLPETPLTIDFAGVVAITNSFADELLGVLTFGRAQLTIVGASRDVRETLAVEIERRGLVDKVLLDG